jgi:hypothetical protein
MRIMDVVFRSRRPPMMDAISLCVSVHCRFCRSFGIPRRSSATGWQWSLSHCPGLTGIKVLVETQDDLPIVLVFDPNRAADGVTEHRVETDADVEALVRRIRRAPKRRVTVQGTPKIGCSPSASDEGHVATLDE